MTLSGGCSSQPLPVLFNLILLIQPTCAVFSKLKVYPLNRARQCDSSVGLPQHSLPKDLYWPCQLEILYIGLLQRHRRQVDRGWQ